MTNVLIVIISIIPIILVAVLLYRMPRNEHYTITEEAKREWELKKKERRFLKDANAEDYFSSLIEYLNQNLFNGEADIESFSDDQVMLFEYSESADALMIGIICDDDGMEIGWASANKQGNMKHYKSRTGFTEERQIEIGEEIVREVKEWGRK